jgi:maleate isomerase
VSVPLTKLDFTVDEGFGPQARLGIIVLETDQTIEQELRSFQLDGVAIYHSRIPMEIDVSTDSLAAMLQRLPEAAALLPQGFDLDVVGYACTSAATVIGSDAVADAIRTAHPGVACTDPITAAMAAFRALGSKRIAVVTPYVEDVTERIVSTFQSHGLEVVGAGSFMEPSDLVVARISEGSIANGVREIVAASDCDAAFISCTSLRSHRIIPKLEAELDIPVVSSNQAFLWHLLRLGGVQDIMEQHGRLFTKPLG